MCPVSDGQQIEDDVKKAGENRMHSRQTQKYVNLWEGDGGGGGGRRYGWILLILRYPSKKQRINFDFKFRKIQNVEVDIDCNTAVQWRTLEIINCCWCFVTYVVAMQEVCVCAPAMECESHMLCSCPTKRAFTSIWVFQFYCMFFYILFTVSCRLRWLMRVRWHQVWLAWGGMQRIPRRRHFWDNRRMHKYIFLYAHRSWSNDEQNARTQHTSTYPNASRVRLFNEPKRMKESNEWTHSLQSFTEMNRNKIEINVFLCYETGSYPYERGVLRFRLWACSFTIRTTDKHIQFNSEKCFVQNRLLFHFACSTNSRTPRLLLWERACLWS